MVRIRPCSSKSDFDLAIEITQAYMRWIDLDLSFQDVDAEFKKFKTMYGPPDGLFLLGFVDRVLAGGVGIRNLEDKICEMKRLYVYNNYKGMGVGKRLCAELITHAKQMNYQFMRLDTLDRMTSARRLYSSFGFKPIDSYCFNPIADVVYMELKL